jgi:hypothetical protein
LISTNESTDTQHGGHKASRTNATKIAVAA